MPKPGKQNAQKLARQAADMTVVEEEWCYTPPPKEACEEHSYPVPLDDEGLIQYVWAQQVYRGKVVHFSVEIQVRAHAMADWDVAYRIDTSHGTVHDHRFSPSVDAVRTQIETIPRQDSWDFVDEWFSKAMKMCEDQWSVHVERWGR